MRTNILYIGRGRPAPAMLWQELGALGYQITVVTTKKLALELVVSSQPSVAVVDGTSSRISGPSTCRALRRCSTDLPLILITDPLETPPASLADALLPRPFTARRFTQCLEQVLKSVAVLRLGDLSLEVRTHCVCGPCGVHHLNPKEFALLELFMRNPGRILSRRELMRAIWQTSYLGDTRTLDVHIRWLREKIERDPGEPQQLITHRSAGYELRHPTPPTGRLKAQA